MSLISLNETEPTDVAVVAETADTASRVAWCNELHGQVATALERAWQTAVVLGWELKKLKQSMQHGEWGKLFESNSKSEPWFRFGERQARKYMDLHTRCALAAGKCEALPTGELERLLLEFSEKRLPETAERLTAVFNKLAPEATSMRQALFEFMKQEPEFTKRNELGRIKKDTPPEVLAKAATQELATHARQLEEIMDSGRYTLADEATRRQMEAVCAAFAAKLKAVK